MKRILPWLLTDSGKKFSYYAAGGCSIAALLGHVIPHTILIEQYKEILHLYKDGFTEPVPPKLQRTFKKALDMCEIDQRDQHLFKPFMGYGFDVFSIGTSMSRFGVKIGLPFNFTYEQAGDTAEDKHRITIGDNSVEWDTLEGRALLNSYIFTENAKLYAIAREIKFRQTPKVIMDSVASVLVCTGIYGLGNTINTRFNLYARPFQIRLGVYMLLGLFGAVNYLLFKDATQVYFEEKIDEELKKNELLRLGGWEYYEKLCLRNKAIRALLGKEGEKAYTALGNEKYLFRYKHIPLVQRKLLFESNL